ncbi:hypothetical protein [Paenibacillus sp. A14]|uniref:hypothetical protein n=1 Tax=Paenibacillus sp. A14 TaxID=3119820 RepID=UPI002FDFDFBF
MPVATISAFIVPGERRTFEERRSPKLAGAFQRKTGALPGIRTEVSSSPGILTEAIAAISSFTHELTF